MFCTGSEAAVEEKEDGMESLPKQEEHGTVIPDTFNIIQSQPQKLQTPL